MRTRNYVQFDKVHRDFGKEACPYIIEVRDGWINTGAIIH